MTSRFMAILTGSLTLLSLISLVFYLSQVEKTVKESYLIQQYQQKLTALSEENLSAEQKMNEALSLENAEGAVKTLGFVQISEVKHIPVSPDYLVKE